MTRGVANLKPREYTCAPFGLVRDTDVPIPPLDQSLEVWWLRVMMYIDTVVPTITILYTTIIVIIET